jgi:glycosyltransferase involved in cell wall biosynthesis
LKTIAILGTAGIPAAYGGFETLAENLVRYHQAAALDSDVVVYCSGPILSGQARRTSYLGAQLRYIPFRANGISSVFYDVFSLFSAARHGCDTVLLLGVSGAIGLPFLRLLTGIRIITNVDGIEWKRQKWSGAAKWFLRMSERIAAKFSHDLIADNAGIAIHVESAYGRRTHVIAYGGDHALREGAQLFPGSTLPKRYALSICRIEPENNVALILDAFSHNPHFPLVFVGNWANSAFGLKLRRRYGSVRHMHLLDPIYDLDVLSGLRARASAYVHGHSAGGTNPSLVEMMHFGVPVLTYDCEFNRFTTEEKAVFFADKEELDDILNSWSDSEMEAVGSEMKRIAQARYTWDKIGRMYFDLLRDIKPAYQPSGSASATVTEQSK